MTKVTYGMGTVTQNCCVFKIMIDKTESIIGCLLGTAVGDGLGLPYEGLSAARQRRIMPDFSQHNLFFGKGMISDDTEHTCIVAQSLIVSAGEEKAFIRSLAWGLRWWLLGLPAGIGYATLRAILRLWFGFSPLRSGVFSAGNGAAMRSPILGVCYGHSRDLLATLVKVSTRITHGDPKAEYGALAMAIAAYLASCQLEVSPQAYYQTLEDNLDSQAREFLELIQQACVSAERGESGANFATSLGLFRGISGYVYHTVPVVIQVWLRHQKDYDTGVKEIIQLGGDTDTTGAILGGIIGAAVGKEGIPKLWIDGLWEYPRSVKWIESVGKKLGAVCRDSKPQKAVFLPFYAVIIRNLWFLLVVLFHGFRRLFPP